MVGVRLSAMSPIISVSAEYITYISAMLEDMNAIFPIDVAAEVSSTQLSSKVTPLY